MHPRVTEQYEQNDFDFQKSPNDINIERFDLSVEKSQQPVRQEIGQVIRLKHKGKEKFYYHIASKSKDSLGNSIHKFETIGYYDNPSFTHRVDEETGKTISIEVEDTERVYELDFPQDFTQELENLLSDKVSLIVKARTGRHYAIADYLDFKNCTTDELEMIGRTGTKNSVIMREMEKEKEKRKVK